MSRRGAYQQHYQSAYVPYSYISHRRELIELNYMRDRRCPTVGVERWQSRMWRESPRASGGGFITNDTTNNNVFKQPDYHCVCRACALTSVSPLTTRHTTPRSSRAYHAICHPVIAPCIRLILNHLLFPHSTVLHAIFTRS